MRGMRILSFWPVMYFQMSPYSFLLYYWIWSSFPFPGPVMIVSFAFIINVQVEHKIIDDLLTTYLRQYSSSLSFHRICCWKKMFGFLYCFSHSYDWDFKKMGMPTAWTGSSREPRGANSSLCFCRHTVALFVDSWPFSVTWFCNPGYYNKFSL